MQGRQRPIVLPAAIDIEVLMRLPFSAEQFFGVFQRYNDAVWPLQVVLYVLALIAVALALRRDARTREDRAIAGVLAFLWLWMGVVYHLVFFRRINPVAAFFGLAFVAQGGLLLRYGVHRRRLRFGMTLDVRGRAGAVLVVYALVVYPLLGVVAGHAYPATPTFGLPCPTTIFTLGLLLWSAPPAPWTVLAIPLGWAVLATSAATQLGVREDYGLAVAGLVVVALDLRERLARSGSKRARA